MSRTFKVGDRVRINDKASDHNGQVGSVSAVTNGEFAFVSFQEEEGAPSTFFYMFDELLPVSEPVTDECIEIQP